MSVLDHLPIPTFCITEHYAVVGASQTARHAFVEGKHLLDIVDAGSAEKLKRFVRPAMSGIRVELNFLTPNGIGLFDVYQRWRNEGGDAIGYLTCVPRQSDLNEVIESVTRLDKRLPKRHPGGLRLVEPAPSAPSIWEHVDHSLRTIEELVGMLRADLIELGKGVYAELVFKELDSLRQIIAAEGGRRGDRPALLAPGAISR
ncbi:hypothetical protein [Alicyclobacillus sendaiensis]|uniref:Uncharacterized protein n=1 Tax=Alicyclobacillus sendaiensis PA2 TaxID=3029425 RepID=A0ABT6XYE2_ALISE|nr:hypothetical protein [Alicyclobacillus sendaiensis]MDI9260112.1 hypothetical protein [Alicyclobacillus sendaiensis PA2]